MKYAVTAIETHARQFIVEADSLREAEDIASNRAKKAARERILASDRLRRHYSIVAIEVPDASE